MCVEVVSRRASDDADIGLGFGAISQDDRALNLHEPSVAECALQRPGDEHHGGPVKAVLRLFDEQQPVEQLDRRVFVEHAVRDQPGVLAPGQSVEFRGHGQFGRRFACTRRYMPSMFSGNQSFGPHAPYFGSVMSCFISSTDLPSRV